MSKEMVTPRPLRDGSRVAIISPASVVKEEYIEGACRWIRSQGWQPLLMPHCAGPSSGTYAASEANRSADLQAAILDDDVDAVLCARGGYGCVHLICDIPAVVLRENAKWVIGFSDVSALHAMMWNAGVKSLHAPMAKHLTLHPADDMSRRLADLLRGALPAPITAAAQPGSIRGETVGILRGGNLAVLDGLAGTDFDMLNVGAGEEVILFVEDISEPIYKVERMLWRLHLCGALRNARGLICGQFTEYRADANFPHVESMIARRLRQWGYTSMPVAMGFPVGHVDHNEPLVQGARYRLRVDDDTASLAPVSDFMS